jgi:hypothetical protein
MPKEDYSVTPTKRGAKDLMKSEDYQLKVGIDE